MLWLHDLSDDKTLSLWFCVFITFSNYSSPESLMKRSLDSIILGRLVALESYAKEQNEKCSGDKI